MRKSKTRTIVAAPPTSLKVFVIAVVGMFIAAGAPFVGPAGDGVVARAQESEAVEEVTIGEDLESDQVIVSDVPQVTASESDSGERVTSQRGIESNDALISDAAPANEVYAGDEIPFIDFGSTPGEGVIRQFWVNTASNFYRIDISDDFPAKAGKQSPQTVYTVAKQFKAQKSYGDIAITRDGKTIYAIQFTTRSTGRNAGKFTLDVYDAATGEVTDSAIIDMSEVQLELQDNYLEGPELNSLTVDHDGTLLTASAKSPKVWRIDPAKCLAQRECKLGTAGTGEGVEDTGLRFPSGLTAAGDFVVGADGSLYGVATASSGAGIGQGKSALVRWPVAVPGKPSQGRSSTAVTLGELAQTAWGAGRVEDQILFAKALAGNDIFKQAVSVDGKLGDGEQISERTIQGRMVGAGFYGATAPGDSGPVPGEEKLLILEKEVRGERHKKNDAFRLTSSRAGSNESMGTPAVTDGPEIGEQTQRHYSYVTNGQDWTVSEEYLAPGGNSPGTSKEENSLSNYNTTLKCVDGDWTEDAPALKVTDISFNEASNSRSASFTIPETDTQMVTCRFINSLGISIAKYPSAESVPDNLSDTDRGPADLTESAGEEVSIQPSDSEETAAQSGNLQPSQDRARRLPAPEVRVGEDGRATIAYSVEATNNSPKTLTSAAIRDLIRLPEGVSADGDAIIRSVIDGAGDGAINGSVEKWEQESIIAGAELLLADSATLAKGQTARFTIEIPIKVDDNLNEAQWAVLGKCVMSEDDGSYVSGGVPNDVVMDKDLDGVANNTGCVRLVRHTDTSSVRLQLFKIGLDNNGQYVELDGSVFELFAEHESQPGHLGELISEVGVNPKVDQVVRPEDQVSVSGLKLNTRYYLVEVQAPEHFELLAKPVCFMLSKNGADEPVNPGQVGVTACEAQEFDTAIMTNNPLNPEEKQFLDKDTAVMAIADVRSGLLPESGRPDLFYRSLLGLFLVAVGSAWVLRREGYGLAKE